MSQSLSKTEQTVYAFIEKQARGLNAKPIPYQRKAFEVGTKLSASTVAQGLNGLVRKKMLNRHQACGQNPSYSIRDEEALARMALCSLIQTKGPVIKQYKSLAKALKINEAQTKKMVTQALKAGLIVEANVDKKGLCLSLSAPTITDKDAATPHRQAGLTYLVDTENVCNLESYSGLATLTSKDTIVLMLSQNSRLFSNPLLVRDMFGKCKAVVDVRYQAVSGKDALDFLIISEAAVRLTQNATRCICIISKDTGYDAPITHLKETLGLTANHLFRKGKI